MGKPKKTLPLLALVIPLGLNAAIILLALHFRQVVVPGWKKGPLIDPAAPYSPENATVLFAVAACLALDLYLGLAYMWHRKLPRRWWAPWGLLLLSALAAELFVRAYLALDMVTYFRPHPTLHWVVRPNLRGFQNLTGGGTISTNSDGMREVRVPRHKEPDEFRILVLGDSSNFGHGVEGDEVWSSVFQEILGRQRRSRKVEVLNGACPGWTTYQAVEFMEETGLRYHPDVVVAGFNNDPGPDYLGDRQRVLPPGPVRSLNAALFHLETYLLAREVVLSTVRRYWNSRGYTARRAGQEPTYGSLPREETASLVPRVSLEEFEENLRTLATPDRGGLDTGGEPYFFAWLNMPINRTHPDLVARYVDYDYREAAARLGQEIGFPVIDVDAAWRDEPPGSLFLPGHVFHPNAAGHRKIAQQVAATLLELGVLPPVEEGEELALRHQESPPAGAPSSDPAAAPRKGGDRLVFGYSSFTPVHAHLGLVLRDHPELARDLGFDLELRSYQSGKEQGRDVASGALDAFFTCEVPAVQMLRSQPDARIVASPGYLGRIAVVARSDRASSLEDLVGGKVGLAPGSTPAMDWRDWSRGLQVQVVELGTEDLWPALRDGRVDAAVGWDPWVEQWLRQGEGSVAILEQRLFRSELAVSTSWARQGEDRVPRLLSLVDRAMATAAASRDHYDQEVARTSGWPLEVVKAVADMNQGLSGGPISLGLTAEDRSSLERALSFVGEPNPDPERFIASWPEASPEPAAPSPPPPADERAPARSP